MWDIDRTIGAMGGSPGIVDASKPWDATTVTLDLAAGAHVLRAFLGSMGSVVMLPAQRSASFGYRGRDIGLEPLVAGDGVGKSRPLVDGLGDDRGRVVGEPGDHVQAAFESFQRGKSYRLESAAPVTVNATGAVDDGLSGLLTAIYGVYHDLLARH